MSNVISAGELAGRRFNGLKLPVPFVDLLGEIEQQTYILIWGPPGSGKSTLTLALANALADNGPVMYVSAEEGHGKTVADRIRRIRATNSNLLIAEFSDLDETKRLITTHRAKFAMLDSISEIDPRSNEIGAFKKWCKERGIGLILIAHAQKTGLNYKGPSDVGHGTDIVVEVRDGVAKSSKNRYTPLAEIPVPFTADSLPKRPNPVPVPFTITLGKLAKQHKIRGVNRLNSLVGHQYGCLARRHSGETEHARISFRYKRDQKVSILELYLAEHLFDYAHGDDFEAALKGILAKHADLELNIFKQDHAKLILGNAEYRRQEKANGGKPATASKEVASQLPKATSPRTKKSKAAPLPSKKRPTPQIAPPLAPSAYQSKPKPKPAAPADDSSGTAFDAGLSKIEALLGKALSV